MPEDQARHAERQRYAARQGAKDGKTGKYCPPPFDGLYGACRGAYDAAYQSEMLAAEIAREESDD